MFQSSEIRMFYDFSMGKKCSKAQPLRRDDTSGHPGAFPPGEAGFWPKDMCTVINIITRWCPLDS